MGGRINCYLDIASFFSYVAFEDLRQNIDKLKANGVEVDFIPILLGGVNSMSGNKPPWLLPAKAAYLAGDSQRAAKRVGVHGLQTPKDLMSMAMTISPLRALHYIKANYPERFLPTMSALFQKFWTPPNVNLTQEENLITTLLEATYEGKRLFTEVEVEKIMKGRDGMKALLKAKTEEVVNSGAFGAPWFLVTNAKGETRSFFGSDRFNHIYRHLEIPFQDIAVLPPSKM